MIDKKATIATFAGALLLTVSPLAFAAEDTSSDRAKVSTTAASSTQAAGQVKAQELVGRDVQNARGDDIGDIEAIILDQKGNTAAVIIGVGGFLGIGEREVAVQWDELNISNDGKKVTVNMTKDQLKSLPEYKFSENKYRRTAFHDRNYRVADARDRRESSMERATKRNDRRAHSATFGPAGELRASKIIGANVVTSRDDEIGEVEEILIGRSGKLQVVLSVGGFLGMGEHDITLDWDKLTIIRQKDDRDDLRIRVNMDKEAMKKLPQYDRRK